MMFFENDVAIGPAGSQSPRMRTRELAIISILIHDATQLALNPTVSF